ncbi:hypothetical protein [Novosphingobium profundi]|uniref:hypothetical protein n=1 Tax=Novosphingobium profundi TaxID=1774954 RepID=UPI001CFCA52F|nr:hypothetical protein [Novosphingobium profundi]
MSETFPWSVLGIAPTSDRKAIRKAYAAAVKAMDIDAEVDAYAHLRSARDQALALARETPVDAVSPLALRDVSEDGGDPLPGDEGASSSSSGFWPLAAPRLLRPLGEGSVRTAPQTPEPAPGRPCFETIFPDAPADTPIAATLELGPHQSLAAPTLSGYGEIEAALGLIPGQTACERLEAVLTESDDAELAEAERIVALRALQAAIGEARSEGIDRQEQVEDWLAGLLATHWPRSAPLLETATQAFGWHEEWHRFDARPAVRFIGARLRGARFRARVEDPGHRYHAAWRELNRKGPAGPFRWLRASRDDVQFVLSGLRANFAHLEDELDPRRIASWNRPVIWPRVVLGLCWLALLANLLGLSWPFVSPAYELPDGTQIELAEDGPGPTLFGEYLETAVAESLGQGHDLAWLWDRDAELARRIVAQVRASLDSGGGAEGATRAAVNLVRAATHAKGHTLSGEAREAAMRLRLDQLRAAREMAPATCLTLLHDGQLPQQASAFPEPLRARERAAAARLAETPLPPENPGEEDTSVPIPGALIDAIIARTGLPDAAVREALQNEGEDAPRCDVAIALLAAALDWDGEPATREAILRAL